MSASTSHSPKEVVTLFKDILKEAASLYGVKPNEVTGCQFACASAGRLGRQSMTKCGGFSILRDYVAPKIKTSKQTVMLLKKVLK